MIFTSYEFLFIRTVTPSLFPGGNVNFIIFLLDSLVFVNVYVVMLFRSIMAVFILWLKYFVKSVSFSLWIFIIVPIRSLLRITVGNFKPKVRNFKPKVRNSSSVLDSFISYRFSVRSGLPTYFHLLLVHAEFIFLSLLVWFLLICSFVFCK